MYVLGGYAQVGGHRQAEPRADGGAVDGCDDGDGEAADGEERLRVCVGGGNVWLLEGVRVCGSARRMSLLAWVGGGRSGRIAAKGKRSLIDFAYRIKSSHDVDVVLGAGPSALVQPRQVPAGLKNKDGDGSRSIGRGGEKGRQVGAQQPNPFNNAQSSPSIN